MLHSSTRSETPASTRNGTPEPWLQDRQKLQPARDVPVGGPVLIPIHLDRVDRASLLLALKLAASHSGEIVLLHVLAAEDDASSNHWLDAIDRLHRLKPIRAGNASTAIETTRKAIVAFLDREIPATLRGALKLRCECRLGDPATEIARFADEQAIEMVIVCSPGVARRWALWPSLSQQILERTRKPVIFVHSRGSNGTAR